MRHIIDRARQVLAVGVLAATLLPMAACGNVKEDLLAADDPDIITPDAVKSAEGADALRIGAINRINGITAGGEGAWLLGGLLTDEWKSSDTFSQRNETDERKVQDNNANVQTMYRALHRPRTNAIEAIAALKEFKPLPASNFGQMYFVMGFSELTLAENFCNGTPFGESSTGVPIYGAPVTNAEAFAMALAHFDTALTYTTATDAATIAVKNMNLVAKGRTLINLGRFADAATAVAAVPTAFAYNAEFSLNTTSNQIWSLNNSAKRWTVGDSFDTSGLIKNAIPFASLADPRLPISGTATGTSPEGRGFDGQTNFIIQKVYGRTDPTAIVSGLDARLMEAEAKLNANDLAGMTTILNALRAAPPKLGAITPTGLTALATPATKDAAINVFFREKALWTYGRGQRLPDLRRQVRQYGRTQDTVFPNGTFFKTNTAYGPDVNFPVTTDELNNPAFEGCIDRKA